MYWNRNLILIIAIKQPLHTKKKKSLWFLFLVRMNPYAYHYVSKEPPTPIPNKKPKNKKPLSHFHTSSCIEYTNFRIYLEDTNYKDIINTYLSILSTQ